MFFLLRMAFWLGVVCLLLPNNSGSHTNDIDAKEVGTVASAAVSDMHGFCARQPDACVAGSKIAIAVGQKVEAGARTMFEFVSNKLAGESTASAPIPKAKTAAKVTPVSAHEQGTLTRTDLQPAWRGPVPLPPRRPSV